ncbi:MAG: hypothetical protein FWD87_08125 [Spirochaetaceae bacterium]|nr:hypothetical protein [Spirochaetaceae bacterium]
MNTSLLASIKWIITKHGENILGDPIQLKKIFANYTKNEPKEERVAFGCCIEMGCYRKLKKARNINERSQIKADLAYKLHSSTGINMSLCRDTLDMLDAAIFGDVAPALPAASPVQSSLKPSSHIWKKLELKWVRLGIVATLLIFLIFSFAFRTITQSKKDLLDETVDNRIEDRIETLERIAKHQEHIAGQLEQLRKQIAGEQSGQNPSVQNTAQQKTENESLIEKLQNDLLMEILAIKRANRRDISGRIKVLVFPTNYRGSLFRMNLDTLRASVQEGIQIIQEQARKYNQNISIDFDIVTASNGLYVSINSFQEGLRQFSRHRSRYMNYNHVVLVHAIDMVGRSYIIVAEPIGKNEEHIIMWFKGHDGFCAGTLAHEIFHAFGAEDLYYEQGVVPGNVENYFKTLLGNSIMIDSHRYSNLDPINAWLIGWNKNPEPWYAWFINKRDNAVALWVKDKEKVQ